MIKHIKDHHHPYEKVYKCPLGCIESLGQLMKKDDLKDHLIKTCKQIEVGCITCTLGQKRCYF